MYQSLKETDKKLHNYFTISKLYPLYSDVHRNKSVYSYGEYSI